MTVDPKALAAAVGGLRRPAAAAAAGNVTAAAAAAAGNITAGKTGLPHEPAAAAANAAAAGPGPYLRFVLSKAGWDTAGLLDRLARALGVPARAFTVAGLKDKTGVTEQEVPGDSDI